jgi:hypothetical protein
MISVLNESMISVKTLIVNNESQSPFTCVMLDECINNEKVTVTDWQKGCGYIAGCPDGAYPYFHSNGLLYLFDKNKGESVIQNSDQISDEDTSDLERSNDDEKENFEENLSRKRRRNCCLFVVSVVLSVIFLKNFFNILSYVRSHLRF